MLTLSPSELIAVTGKRRAASQASVLARMGVPFAFAGHAVLVDRACSDGACAAAASSAGRRRLVSGEVEAMTLQERIDQLVQQHGSLRALARVMEVSPPYICRLRSGVTKNPGTTVLRRLGLRRVVSYELIGNPKG